MGERKVTFIDIYIGYVKETTRIAIITEKDLKNFKNSEPAEKLGLRFYQ